MFNDFKNSEAKYFNHFMVWYPKALLCQLFRVVLAKIASAWYITLVNGQMNLHEWLRCIDSMMLRIGYPDYLLPSLDGGRDEGYSGSDPQVDPDYCRPAGEATWYGYYCHVRQEYTIPRMWRQLVTEYVRPP